MIELFAGRYRGVDIRHLPGGRRVKLLQPIITAYGIVPQGFTCNLDSIPRHAGPLYAVYKGRTIIGAIVHDYCYRHRVNRKTADDYFLAVMEWEGVRTRYRKPIYWAVRLFGGLTYPNRGQSHA